MVREHDQNQRNEDVEQRPPPELAPEAKAAAPHASAERHIPEQQQRGDLDERKAAGQHRNANFDPVALERPPQSNMPSMFQAAGMLPSLVELAIKGNKLDDVRHACRERGDEITFAATWLNT